MQQPHEISTPHLSPAQRAVLVTAIAAAEQGLEVRIALTYSKQTSARPRIAGEDYLALPGVSPEAQMGVLRVKRYTASKANVRSGKAGKIYLLVESLTRGDGLKPVGYTAMRPEGIKEFTVVAVNPIAQSA